MAAGAGLAGCAADGSSGSPGTAGAGDVDDAPGFERGPYLTRVTDTGARLRWIAPPGARVRVMATAPDGTAIRARRGELADLAPDTRYRWVATLDGRPAAQGTIHTAPADLRGPLDLIAFGDSGADNDPSRAVAAMAAREDARLLLGMGDNAFPVVTPRGLDRQVFGPLGPALARMPHYGTVGDHDIPLPDGQRALAEAYDWPGRGARYALRHGPVQVIALGLKGDADDVPFLRRALARPGPAARFVLVHRPPQPGDPILPVLARGPVTAVLAGHLHAYERRSLEAVPGVPFLTVGTGGAPRSADPRHTPRSDDARVHVARFGLLRIRLQGDRATYAFVDTDGVEHDRHTAPLRP